MPILRAALRPGTSPVVPVRRARWYRLRRPLRCVDMRDRPLDTLGRPMHDLRISVTDRCNFRCVYCMPMEVFGRVVAFLPRSVVRAYEEVAGIARSRRP